MVSNTTASADQIKTYPCFSLSSKEILVLSSSELGRNGAVSPARILLFSRTFPVRASFHLTNSPGWVHVTIIDRAFLEPRRRSFFEVTLHGAKHAVHFEIVAGLEQCKQPRGRRELVIIDQGDILPSTFSTTLFRARAMLRVGSTQYSMGAAQAWRISATAAWADLASSLSATTIEYVNNPPVCWRSNSARRRLSISGRLYVQTQTEMCATSFAGAELTESMSPAIFTRLTPMPAGFMQCSPRQRRDYRNAGHSPEPQLPRLHGDQTFCQPETCIPGRGSDGSRLRR